MKNVFSFSLETCNVLVRKYLAFWSSPLFRIRVNREYEIKQRESNDVRCALRAEVTLTNRERLSYPTYSLCLGADGRFQPRGAIGSCSFAESLVT